MVTCVHHLLVQAGTPSFYFLSLDLDLVIDAKSKANLARFINHSCDPNCITRVWNVAGEKRVGIFAQRLIAAGEELTFDYQVISSAIEIAVCSFPNKQLSLIRSATT